MSPDVIVSSDLQRAQDTAGELSALTGVPVQIDPAFRETHAGVWEGLHRTELEQLHGAEVAAWAAGSNLAPGGGERRSEVADRMVAGISRALADVPAGGTLVVATHGGSARAAIGRLLDLPASHWGILGVLSNCAWCVLAETSGLDTGSLADLSTDPSEQFPDVPPTPPWRLVEYNARSLPTEAVGDDR